MNRTVHRQDTLVDCLRNREQVGNAGSARLVVHHHVELAGEDQHADTGQHAFDHGRGNGSEPSAKFGGAGGHLNEPRAEHDPSQGLHSELVDELPDQHGETCRRTADLQWRTADEADDQAADNAADQAQGGQDTRGDGDAHAKGRATRNTTTDAINSRRQSVFSVGVFINLPLIECFRPARRLRSIPVVWFLRPLLFHRLRCCRPSHAVEAFRLLRLPGRNRVCAGSRAAIARWQR